MAESATNNEGIRNAVLDAYALSGAQIHLLQSRWNHIYRVEAADGARYSLRICAPEFKDRRWMQDELAFLDFVAEVGTICAPRPVRNRDGALITAIPAEEGERLACLFEWVEGEPSYRNLTVDMMAQIGRLTAHLHEIGRAFLFPDATNGFRADYRYDQALARSHREWIPEHRAEIGPENEALLQRAIDFVVEGMDRVGQARATYGVIHADLHFGNFLVHNGQVSLIDFDQLGRGHYCYDIAFLLTELYDEPESQPARWQAFKAGYAEVTPLPFDDDAELAPFLIAVGLAFLDWVYNAPNPQVRAEKMRYAPGVYRMLREKIGARQVHSPVDKISKRQTISEPTERIEIAQKLLGAGRAFSPERDAVAELMAERATDERTYDG
ncbi:MAG: phosphotransferase [Chloroflexi bacterium]|nr:phosphotransferase [Chloroflexota bacterium]